MIRHLLLGRRGCLGRFRGHRCRDGLALRWRYWQNANIVGGKLDTGVAALFILG